MVTQCYIVTPRRIANCLPLTLLDGVAPNYDAFLHQRRRLMAAKIKTYFQTL